MLGNPKHRCLDCGTPLYHRGGPVSKRCQSCNCRRIANLRWHPIKPSHWTVKALLNRLYNMPLRLGYWLLLPFITVYNILTTHVDKRRFILNSGSSRVVVHPGELTGSFDLHEVAVLREYLRRHPA